MPNRPPACSAIWLRGERRRASSLMTRMNSPRSAGSDVSTGSLSVSASRLRPGITWSIGPDSRVERASAASTVRRTWGSIARTGSSKSLSSPLTRSAVALRFVIVALKFSSPRISSSAPFRSWSNERMTAAIGPATSEITSANGSVRPVSATAANATGQLSSDDA